MKLLKKKIVWIFLNVLLYFLFLQFSYAQPVLAADCQLTVIAGVLNLPGVATGRAQFDGNCDGQKVDFYFCTQPGVFDIKCDRALGASAIVSNYANTSAEVQIKANTQYYIEARFAGQVKRTAVLKAGTLPNPSTSETKFCAFKEKGLTKCISGSEALALKDNCKDASGGSWSSGVSVNCAEAGCFAVKRDQCSNAGQIDPFRPSINLNLKSDSFNFKIDNPLNGKADNIIDLLAILANFIFQLGVPVTVIIIIYSGILYLVSAGRSAVYQKATNGLKYAAIGLAILLIGKGFVSLIQSLLSIK